MTDASDKPRPYTREHGYNSERSAWNDERIEALKKGWADGLSASQIAERLGGFHHCSDNGRSAVIGKLNRLGLKREIRERGRGPSHLRRRRVSPLQKAHRENLHKLFFVPRQRQAEDAPVAIVDAIPPRQRKSLQQLEETSCRWPVGDPRQPDFHFCGARRGEDSSYCRAHEKRAYDQQPPRRKPQPIRLVPTFESYVKEDA